MPDNVNRPGVTLDEEFSHLTTPTGFPISEWIKRIVGLLPSDEDLGVNTTDIITDGGLPAGPVPPSDTRQHGLNFTQPVPIPPRPEQKPENIIHVQDVAVTPALEQPIYDPSAQAQSDLDAANAAARQTAPVNNPNSWNYGFGLPFGLTEAHGINDPYNNIAINALEAGDIVNKRMRNREQPTLMGGGVDLSSLFQKGKDIFFSDPMQNFFQLSRDALAQPVNPGDWGVEPFARAQVARNQLEYEREQDRLEREMTEADLAARREATAYDRRLALENLGIRKEQLDISKQLIEPKINKTTLDNMKSIIQSMEDLDYRDLYDYVPDWMTTDDKPSKDTTESAIAQRALELQKQYPDLRGNSSRAIQLAIQSLREEAGIPTTTSTNGATPTDGSGNTGKFDVDGTIGK